MPGLTPTQVSPQEAGSGSRPCLLGPIGYFLRLSFIGRCLLVLGALLVVVCLFFAEENIRGQRTWEISLRKLKARGVELEWQEFIPTPVPDHQNFAMTPFL